MWLFLSLILCTLAIAGSIALFYSEKGNQDGLKSLQSEAQQTQSLMVKNIESLTASLIFIHSHPEKKGIYFNFIGVADKVTGRILSVNPSRYISWMKNLKIPPSDFKNYPVSFRPLKSKPGQVLLLVDRNQIDTATLSLEKYQNQIIFGLLSPQGSSLLSRSFGREGFIVQNSSRWTPVHSQKKYSGQYLPPSFEKFKGLKKWKTVLEEEQKLSVGLPMGITKGSLVLKASSQNWSQHFMSIIYEVSTMMFLSGLAILALCYFFFHPLREAYKYLYWWLNSFTTTNSLPIPNPDNKNIYIQKVQKGMSQLFMRLREGRFSEVNQKPSTEMFSDVIETICSSNEEFSKAQIRYQFDADIRLQAPLHWLEQPLIEIVKNAVESMNGSGQIDISTFREEQMFCCKIRDYGLGMMSLVMSEACQAYYTSKPDAKGLGLTLAYSSLSRAGCRLYFQNVNEGKGLEVQISIPLSKEVGYSVSQDQVYDS